MAEPDMSHPLIQQRLRELEQMVYDTLLPHLITVREDNVVEMHGIMADQADWLLRAGLDQQVASGGLLSYEYGSVIDPLDPDGVLYVQLGLVLPACPDKIMIQFRMDDDE